MKITKRIILVTLTVILLTPLKGHASLEGGIPSDFDLSGVKSAEIRLGRTVKGDKLSLIDGGDTDAGVLHYNIVKNYGGKEARETFASNRMLFRVDDSFVSPGDDLFLLEFEYWDYAGTGSFRVVYSCEDGVGETATGYIFKRGSRDQPAQWRKEAVLISGAALNHSLEFGSDFQIGNNANNAFSAIKIYNLSAVRDRFMSVDTGEYNFNIAKTLHNMGLFEGDKEAITALTVTNTKILKETLTREEAVKKMIIGLSQRDAALSENLTCSFTDVSDENKPYIARGAELGILKSTGVTLGAKETITQGELISYYLNYFNISYTKDSLYEIAKQHKIIRTANGMFQYDKPANLDNIAGLIYNALKMKDAGTGKALIFTLLENGAISLDSIIKSADKEFSASIFEHPIYRKPMEMTDDITGRKWYCLDFFGATIMRSYFTQRSWTMDNKRFMFSDNNKYIYVYDTETYMIQKVGELFKNATFVAMTMAPRSSNFYFLNEKKQIAKINMDVQPYKEEVVVQLPETVWYATDLCVSNDESVISLDCDITDPDTPVNKRSAWYNVAKDELHLELWHDFTKIDGSGYYSMHTSINPVYTNLLLYCCGGAYTGTPPYRTFTRVWMYDIDTRRDWNFFQQYPYGYTPRGLNYGEENCHETWTCDGEYLVMNKGMTDYVGIPGIVLMNKNGRDRKYVGIPKFQFNGEERSIYLTHPGVSSTDPRWVISDSGAGTASFPKSWPIFLIDVNNAKMEMVVNTPWDPTVGTSNMHPHPSMSQDGNKVIFGVVQSDGVGKIGWMDISDMVSVPQNGQRQILSASCEALDYEGFEYDLEPEVSGNEAVYRIKNGKKMYFDVNNDVVWGMTKDVTLSITYWDGGISPIRLEYLAWMGNLLTTKIDQRTTYLKRTGTDRWKTVEVTLKGVNLDNMGLLATDMKISGVASDLVIQSIIAR